MGPIQGFDATGFPVTFAAEVKNFDPLQFVDKKEARKMGRFIHFAFAATQEALAQSGLEITPENADRVGVFIGSSTRTCCKAGRARFRLSLYPR